MKRSVANQQYYRQLRKRVWKFVSKNRYRILKKKYFYQRLLHLPMFNGVFSKYPMKNCDRWRLFKAVMSVIQKSNASIWKRSDDVYMVRITRFLEKRLEGDWQKVFGEITKKRYGNIPHPNKTESIRWFLDWGFKHESDVELDPDKYWVKCNIAPLYWPEDFEYHQDACICQSRYGVNGYTGTVIPKK